jgi:DNA-binding XRE family transcriptional regulator
MIINNANDLKEYREKNSLSQHKVAKSLGFSNRASIHYIETGKREFPERVKMLINYLIADNKL